MIDRFRMVTVRASAEIIVKKSKFICTVAPVEDEAAAASFVEEIRAAHKSATHNCFAYAAGLENFVQRYSDDGEPSGTAGLPIMGVITKQELRNTAVVVTRYFGGTLLGAAGLVRAYTASAIEGIAAAGISEMRLCRRLRITADYTHAGRLTNLFRDAGITPAATEYTDRAIFTVDVPVSAIDSITEDIKDMTSSEVTILEQDLIYSASDKI